MPRIRAALKPGGQAPPLTISESAAASVKAPLPPTPPRTTHKRKRRSRSRVTDSSSEDEDAHDVPEPDSDEEDERTIHRPGVVVNRHKKRRTLTLDAIAEELTESRAEEAFWMGDSKATSSSSRQPSFSKKVAWNRAAARSRERTRSPSSSPPPAPHLLRRGHTGLMSPPPSRRAPIVVPRPATPPPEQLREEPKKGKATALPESDSPNNPFLVNDSPRAVPPGEELTSPDPHTPQKHAEKPILTYVFRGVKVVTANPYYVDEDAAAEREARAHLPIDHPDYSPSDACAPTLLFPEARKRDHARRRVLPSVPVPTSPTPATNRRRKGSLSSDEGRAAHSTAPVPAAPSLSINVEENDHGAMAAAMAARIARRMHQGVIAEGEEPPHTRPSSRIRGAPQLPEKDRSDPIKRALGPPRRAVGVKDEGCD